MPCYNSFAPRNPDWRKASTQYLAHRTMMASFWQSWCSMPRSTRQTVPIWNKVDWGKLKNKAIAFTTEFPPKFEDQNIHEIWKELENHIKHLKNSRYLPSEPAHDIISPGWLQGWSACVARKEKSERRLNTPGLIRNRHSFTSITKQH